MDLQGRVTRILTRPAAEWSTIAAEQETVASLFRNYVVILAAIPAVCLFVGLAIIGGALSAFGAPVLGRLGIAVAFGAAIRSYVQTLVSVFIAAFVVEKLAPSFGSKGDTAQAMKLVAYAYTPVWVAGVLYLLLFLAPLAIIAGLYAIYLFYLGLTPVMGTPKEKVPAYMIVSALVIIVVSICVSVVLRMVMPGPAYGMF